MSAHLDKDTLNAIERAEMSEVSGGLSFFAMAKVLYDTVPESNEKTMGLWKLHESQQFMLRASRFN